MKKKKRGVLGYMPPTKDLIEKLLKENPNATNTEINEYVCKAQKRPRVVSMVGGLVVDIKKKLGIPLKYEMIRHVKQDKSLFEIVFVKEGVFGEEQTALLSEFVSALNVREKSRFEIFERVHPDALEIRRYVKS